MSRRKGTVLIIDDEEEIRESIELLLNSEGLETISAKDGDEGLAKLEDHLIDLVLLDLMLPGKSGMELQKEIKRIDSSLPVVIITAMAGIESAVTAIKEGCFDYVTKPWDNEKLLVIVNNAVKQRQLMSENTQLRRALKERFEFSNIIGKSKVMLHVLNLVSQVAPSRSTVLVQGESGTGKELIAKAIHLKSPRADRAFVPVNSGSMPVELLESTLFGHVRGAFTSAIAAKKGLFEIADQGTIFFDEIGTVGPETQAKLLRVLQEREFMRVGGVETIKVDVRVIAATNVDLAQAVQEGKFREDLYYRLNVITIQLPPLRERKEDIPLLVDFFIAKYREENNKSIRGITPAALKALMDYHWPGNVRELENVIGHACMMTLGDTIDVQDLPPYLQTAGSTHDLAQEPPLAAAETESGMGTLEDQERQLIVRAMQTAGGNQSQAARLLRIGRDALRYKLKKHNL